MRHISELAQLPFVHLNRRTFRLPEVCQSYLGAKPKLPSQGQYQVDPTRIRSEKFDQHKHCEMFKHAPKLPGHSPVESVAKTPFPKIACSPCQPVQVHFCSTSTSEFRLQVQLCCAWPQHGAGTCYSCASLVFPHSAERHASASAAVGLASCCNLA